MKRSSTISLLFVVIAVVAAASACGDDGNGTPDGDTNTPPGAVCGGRDAIQCPPDQYCDFAANDCGRGGAAGECKPRPADCPALLIPELTCGCDDEVYASGCEATAAGADLNANGTCRVENGAFGCGYRQCRLLNQYCKKAGPAQAGQPDEFACGSLAVCGGTPSCACLAAEECGSDCTGDAGSGFTLTCR
jgi:hypothetical protein